MIFVFIVLAVALVAPMVAAGMVIGVAGAALFIPLLAMVLLLSNPDTFMEIAAPIAGAAGAIALTFAAGWLLMRGCRRHIYLGPVVLGSLLAYGFVDIARQLIHF